MDTIVEVKMRRFNEECVNGKDPETDIHERVQRRTRAMGVAGWSRSNGGGASLIDIDEDAGEVGGVSLTVIVASLSSH